VILTFGNKNIERVGKQTATNRRKERFIDEHLLSEKQTGTKNPAEAGFFLHSVVKN